MAEIILFTQNFVALFVESAPWLLLGLLIAGIMHELVPVDLLTRHMGDSSVTAISKAALIGAPLPLCSCGVIPAALGLRRSGASKSSTVSFLVATPETGVDSVSVSYALLGPVFAIARPIAAIVSAITAGVMVKLFDKENDAAASSPQAHKAAPISTSSCCSKKAETTCCASSQASAHANSHTHSEKEPEHRASIRQDISWLAKSSKIIGFASGKLLADITLWLAIGLFLAAAIQTFVPTTFLTQWGDGFMAMLIMALVGIPMYICATASTPLALGFLAAGLSPGAILVFMLAGPATNISTMGMIAKEMGRRTLLIYVSTVVSVSILLGYGLNLLFSLTQWPLPDASMHAHQHSDVAWLYIISALVLAALMLRNTLIKYLANWTHSKALANKM